jgi:prepilin-type N-terminal cleavage/methylation domain-containing protein
MSKRSSRRISHCQQGFSLAEILAVIVILGSLIALLVPTIGAARRSGHKTVCASNLHQIGLASKLYINDYDDRLPVIVNYFVRHAPKVNLGRPEGADPTQYSSPRAALKEYLSAEKVWVCPLDTGTKISSWNAYPRFSEHNDGTSYLFAELFQGQSDSSWREPPNAIWACDGAPHWHAPSYDPYAFNSYRVNALYYDLHVSQDSRNGPTFLE